MWRENSLGNERAHSRSFLMVLPSPEGTEVNALEEGPEQRSCFSSVGHSLTNEGGVMRGSASDLILGVTDSLATPQGWASSSSMSSLAFLAGPRHQAACGPNYCLATFPSGPLWALNFTERLSQSKASNRGSRRGVGDPSQSPACYNTSLFPKKDVRHP